MHNLCKLAYFHYFARFTEHSEHYQRLLRSSFVLKKKDKALMKEICCWLKSGNSDEKRG